MCNQNVLPLSLSGDTFNALKSDFDSILRNTLSNMELKGADTAEMNIKLKISLSKEQTRDFEARYDGAMRDIVKPKFEHAVQSVLQIKDKKDGTLSGNYELVWDGEAQKYVMREITDGQTSLFDEEKKSGFAPDNIVGAGGELPPAKKELPAPEEKGDFIDAEYTVVEDEKPADPGPFDWLRQFVGVDMKVMEAMGNYTVRTGDNKVVLSSAASADSPFYCSAEKLAPHVGHTIVCVLYGATDNEESVFIECDTCGETLFRLDVPAQSEAQDGEDDSAAPASGEDEAPGGYEYDGPDDKEAC